MAGLLHFDYRDIPSCARHGLSARKVWIYFRSLVASWIIWDLFVYLGFLAAGENMGARWEMSALLPLPGGLFWSSWVAVAFLVVAFLLIVHVLMKASLKVCRLTFEQLRGDDFYSGSEASGFASGHRTPLITVPLVLLSAIFIGLLSGWVFGLISRIPAAGPVISALLSVPMWGIMLLVLLTGVAFLLSFVLLPPIVATSRSDSFESMFELYSTMTSQSWRLFVYWILTTFFIVLGGLVFLAFSCSAVTLVAMTTGSGAGDGGLGAAMASGPQLLAPEVLPFFSGSGLLSASADAPAWTGIPGVVAALSGTSIFLVLLSYLLSSCSSGWTIIYLGLRKRKDGVNLLAEADREDMREYRRLYGDGTPTPDRGESQEG